MVIQGAVQLRYDTAANWTANNPTLLSGEVGFESDTSKFKIGDGSTAWITLPYFGGIGGISATSPLSLSAGVLSIPKEDGSTDGYLSSADWTTFNGKASVPISSTDGGTGQTTVTTGDLLYGSAANTWSKLADVASGSVLLSGGIGVAPSWGRTVLFAGPSLLKFRNSNIGAGDSAYGGIGALGTGATETNMFYNMDYETEPGVHHYYDSAKNAFWTAMTSSVFALQYADSGHLNTPGNDVWSQTSDGHGAFSPYLFSFFPLGISILGKLNSTTLLTIGADSNSSALVVVPKDSTTPAIGAYGGALRIEGGVKSADAGTIYLNSLGNGDIFAGGHFTVSGVTAGNPPLISISDPDVAVTDFSGIGFVPTLGANEIGRMTNVSTSYGGMQFACFTKNDVAAIAMFFSGYLGNAAPTGCALAFRGAKTNGSTSATALAATEEVARVYNWTTILHTILGNGAWKMSSMTLLATPQSGALEYDGTDFYSTRAGTRGVIASFATAAIATTTGATSLDFNGVKYQTVTLTGDPSYTTTNRSAASFLTLKIDAGGAGRTLSFSASWKWIGTDYSAGYALSSGKIAVLSLTCYGTAETDVVAALAIQP